MSATSTSYTIAPEAYFKVYFHAAKHPHLPVNGVLLGTQASPRGSVNIQDAVPLLHHWTSLSPMMEIGLDLATQHAESSGMKIVGYYQACERVDDTSLAPVGERVASRIREEFDDAVAFVIDAQKLGTSEAALVPYLPLASSTTWKPAQNERNPFKPGSKFQLSSPDSPTEAAKYVTDQNLHFAFGDFDDHLEDVTIGGVISQGFGRLATKSGVSALIEITGSWSRDGLQTGNQRKIKRSTFNLDRKSNAIESGRMDKWFATTS